MKTRIVYTKLWEDEWFTNLSKTSKLGFIYLITNSRINLSGLYELSDRQILFDLQVTQKELEELKRDLTEKVTFYKNWVYIKNHDKYQIFTGEKNLIAKERELSLVPKDILDTLSIPYRYTMDSPRNQKSIISNHKSEIQNPKTEIKGFKGLKEVVDSFRGTEK